MDQNFIDEVKPIGLLLLAKLKENDYSIVEENEQQTIEYLNIVIHLTVIDYKLSVDII